MQNQNSEQAWEEIYSGQGFNHKNNYPQDEIVRFIARSFFKIPFAQRKKIKILDLGCGWGNNLKFLTDQGFNAYGIDFSPAAIEHSKIINKNVFVGDIKKLPFENQMFDAVIDRCSIQHNNLQNIELIISEVYRVLKKEGKFYSVMVHKLTVPFSVPTYYITEDEVRDVFKGFNHLEIDSQEQTFNNKEVKGVWWHIQTRK